MGDKQGAASASRLPFLAPLPCAFPPGLPPQPSSAAAQRCGQPAAALLGASAHLNSASSSSSRYTALTRCTASSSSLP